MTETAPIPHTPLEDALALVTGTLVVAIGLNLLKGAGLATGGTAGVAFLIHYGTGWPLGLVFFAVNLPFYALSLRVFGLVSTVKTVTAVGLLSLQTDLMPHVVTIAHVQPLFGAAAGGLLAGVGILILVRHRASLGGLNVLVFWLQESRGWRAGKVQMAADAVIVAGALAVIPWQMVALSVVGVAALNEVLTFNHRKGRYQGF